MGAELTRVSPNAAAGRVLVVEDEGDVRGLLELMLDVDGFSFDSAGDGREALEFLGREEYGCVLLDLMMPVVDGFAVLGWMASARPDLLQRVVVVTGGSDELVGRVDERVYRVVRKTAGVRALMQVVRECLGIVPTLGAADAQGRAELPR